MSLRSGDLPPHIVTPPPGPRARAFSARLALAEAPGINTLYRGEPNILWAEARGANVLDVDGNRYLDLTSGFGVAAIGHRHPAVVRAVARQSRALVHGLGDACAHPLRVELAEKLGELAPWSEAAVHWAVSGSDAVEIALKTALLARPGRTRIAAFAPSYHGLGLGALNATSRPLFREPFRAHLHGRVASFPYGGPTAALEAALEAGDVAAVLVEPIAGREGVLLPPPGWLAEIAELCRASDTLLIADEIFTGFGRTGELFACRHDHALPDLICCGKALGGGLPIAAVLGPRELLAAWSTPGEALHTGTFVAHPLACAAALATLEVLESEDLAGRSCRLGAGVGERLASWPDRFPAVAACRGRGLLWGVELANERAAGRLVALARERGVLLLAGGADGRVAQLVPTLTIRERQLEAALSLLEDSLVILSP